MGSGSVLIIGSKQIGLSILETIYKSAKGRLSGFLTIDDSNDPRSSLNAIKKYTLESNIPLYIAKNKTDSERIIFELKPQICFVAGWYYIFSEQTIKSVPQGFIGAHHSLLPKYRGGSPLVWSIINGDDFTGTSLFRFTTGMDDGPIYSQQKIKIEFTDDIGIVLEKANKASIQLLEKNITEILSGNLNPQPQDLSNSSFCSLRLPQDGRINWNWDALRIYNFIRAQTMPYPGAFTTYENEKLTIWSASLQPETYYGTPGQVIHTGKEGVSIICGDNKAIKIGNISYLDKHCPSGSIIKSISTRL